MSLCPGCGKDYAEESINCVAHRNYLNREMVFSGYPCDLCSLPHPRHATWCELYPNPNPPQGGIPDTAPPESPCRKALEMVYGDRERDYGHPSRNFDRIRSLWTAYLVGKYGAEFELDTRDVGWLNLLQKCARDQHRPTPDNLADTAGYTEAMHRAGEGS